MNVKDKEKTVFNGIRLEDLADLITENKNNEADDLVEQALLAKAVGFNYTEQEISCKKEVSYENGKKVKEVSEPVVLEITRFKAAEYNAQVFWLINRRPELWKDKKDIKPPASGEELVRIIDDISQEMSMSQNYPDNTDNADNADYA